MGLVVKKKESKTSLVAKEKRLEKVESQRRAVNGKHNGTNGKKSANGEKKRHKLKKTQMNGPGKGKEA